MRHSDRRADHQPEEAEKENKIEELTKMINKPQVAGRTNAKILGSATPIQHRAEKRRAKQGYQGNTLNFFYYYAKMFLIDSWIKLQQIGI
jgi:hypothetical protein